MSVKKGILGMVCQRRGLKCTPRPLNKEEKEKRIHPETKDKTQKDGCRSQTKCRTGTKNEVFMKGW
jgi:hypothetical protein